MISALSLRAWAGPMAGLASLLAAGGVAACNEGMKTCCLNDTAAVTMGEAHTTKVFHGEKVNVGTVTHTKDGSKNVLTLSDDFKVPETPAPHWQVVDTKGNVYLLQRLKIKDDKINKTITVPAYVADIAKVQIWCAWAEANLGEAEFEAPVK